MNSHIVPILAACGFLAPHASAIITYEDSFDDGEPVSNNFNGHLAPNYAVLLTESTGSLRFGASNLASNWSSVNVNSLDVFQLPLVGQQTSVEWEIGPMTVTTVGERGDGDIRQHLALISNNINKNLFRDDVYGFSSVKGGFLGSEITYKGGTNPNGILVSKNTDSAANAGGNITPDQTGNQIDPTVDNTFKLVLSNNAGVVTVSYFVNDILSTTALLADLLPNGEFDNGFFISNRAQSMADGRGTMSLARVSVDRSDGVAPLPPRLATVFTFDSDLQGFTRWTDALPVQDPTHTTEYGGSAKILIKPGEPAKWRLAGIETFAGRQLSLLQSAATNGGMFSFDIIGETGTLANLAILRAIQPTGAYRWNDFYATIPASSVRPLPDGKEIARYSYALRDFVHSKVDGSGNSLIDKPFITSESNYKLVFNFGGAGAVDRNYYIDNLVIKPFSATDRAKLDFATNTLPFTTLNGATIEPSTVDPESLAFTATGTYGSYVSGDFSSASADAGVIALHTKLQAASHKGGYLQFTLKSPSVVNPVNPTFWGMQPLITHAGQTVNAGYIPPAKFVSGATIPDFQRIYTVPLYPTGSTRTDGLILAADQSSYVIELGVNSAGIDSTTWNIDDFEVIVNEIPQVVSAPLLPAGGGSVFGHVVSNDHGSATYDATGLPDGVTIDPDTGMVTGTPAFNGTYNVVFKASLDGITDSTNSVEWNVSNATDPVDNTVPSITSFSFNGGNPIVIWMGTGATAVNVQRSTTLEAADWINISTGNTTGTFTDTTPPAGGKAFYRVVKP